MPLFDGRLHVHYGQAYVFSGDSADTGEMEMCFRGQTNGLLGAGQPGMLFFTTGLHTGSVELTVDVVEREPRVDEPWEECVEVSFAPAATDVRLVDWDRQFVCQLPLQIRDYRVRYAARGMDKGNAADTIIGAKNQSIPTGSGSGRRLPLRTASSSRRHKPPGIGTSGHRACNHLGTRGMGQCSGMTPERWLSTRARARLLGG